MSKRIAKVTCKTCYQVFTRDEWLAETECSNPKCSCPKVQKAFEMAQNTIQQAKGKVVTTRITKNEVVIPEKAYSDEETDSCVWVEVPMVQTFRVSPIQKQK